MPLLAASTERELQALEQSWREQCEAEDIRTELAQTIERMFRAAQSAKPKRKPERDE